MPPASAPDSEFPRGIAAGLILRAGLVAGTLDILTALLVYGPVLGAIEPVALLQSVASGVFGQAAYRGGLPMAVAGLLFHYLIALTAASVYVALYPRVSLLRRQPIVSGVLYGLIVWGVMNLVVVPLSNVGRGPVTLKGFIIGATILVLMIGLPIAWLTHRAYAGRKL